MLPRIGFKVFPVLNSWIFSLYTCFFRAFLFLVMDTANPQTVLPGKTGNPPREFENSKSVQPPLTAPLAAECLAESGLSDTLRVGIFCALAKICPCLALCVRISVLQRAGRSLRWCRSIQCSHPYVPTTVRVFTIFGHDACLVTDAFALRCIIVTV